METQTEQERKWFGEIEVELRRAGVRGEIRYMGHQGENANAISPQTQGNGLFLICGELSRPGTEAQGIIVPGGFKEIIPIGEGFRLIRNVCDIETQVNAITARKYGSWCVSSPEFYVDRRGNIKN